MNYSFTIQISGIDLDKVEDLFYNTDIDIDCNDILICIVDGRIYLDFDWNASSLSEAIESAKYNIISTGVHVVCVE